MTIYLVGASYNSHLFIQSLSSSIAHCKGKQLYEGLKEYNSLASVKREAYMGGLIILGKSLI